jgi:hypothetical protein
MPINVRDVHVIVFYSTKILFPLCLKKTFKVIPNILENLVEKLQCS